jgi:uncharacterized protein (DUF305 family)
MYGVMFLNVASLDHIYLSMTRLYMTLLMISPMALIMLVFMRKMYTNKKINLFIACTSIAVFTLSLTLLRTQTFISDKEYMKAMIPHHSSAILTSTQSDLKDPEVKQLSADIIRAQEKEISMMKKMLKEK